MAGMATVSESCVVLRRHWEMPNANTFLIPSVAELLREHVGDGSEWADPFANRNSPVQHTNDINPEMPTGHHLDAAEFLAGFDDCSLAGVLLDPPYSMRQIREKYENYGNVKQITPVIREAARVVRVGGYVISFGWNSNGIGKHQNFHTVSIDLIAHGGQHNDTIVTVEQKTAHQSRMF
jgi:hypothetical protein